MLTFVLVVAAMIAIGWALQAYTDRTKRGRSSGTPRDYDDPTSGMWGP